MRRRVNVRGIIINNKGEIFCQQLTANNGKGRNFWCTPGGGLEMGESLLDGLRREMIEETGVKPEIGKLLFIQQFAESGEQSAHGLNEQLDSFSSPTGKITSTSTWNKHRTASKKWRSAASSIQKPREFYQVI